MPSKLIWLDLGRQECKQVWYMINGFVMGQTKKKKKNSQGDLIIN